MSTSSFLELSSKSSSADNKYNIVHLMIYKISWWNKLKVEPGLDMKMILYLTYIYDVQE